MPDMTMERSTKDGPFCWQSKAVRRRIREAFDATNNVASALSVYDALTEIASDTGSDTFTTTHARIQQFSGVGITTIKKRLAVLAEDKLVAISTPKLRCPSTYTLLPIGNGCLSDSHSLPNDGQPSASVSQQAKIDRLATSEENQKNSEESKKGAPLISMKRTPALTEWLAEAKAKYPDWPEGDARCAWEHYESISWMRGKTPISQWRMCVSTCYRIWQRRAPNQVHQPTREKVRVGI